MPFDHPVTKSLLLSAVIGLAGCAHATPVTPVAASAEDAPKIAAAIVGTCEVTTTQNEAGERKPATGLKWTFGPNGQGSFDVPGGMAFGNKFTYRIDGRNILMEGVYKAFRVDDFHGLVLKLFLYDISEVYECTKKG
jgi:hypothetical protein